MLVTPRLARDATFYSPSKCMPGILYSECFVHKLCEIGTNLSLLGLEKKRKLMIHFKKWFSIPNSLSLFSFSIKEREENWECGQTNKQQQQQQQKQKQNSTVTNKLNCHSEIFTRGFLNTKCNHHYCNDSKL